MFVTVIHRIHDPKGFEAAEAKALEAGVPSAHVVLLPHANHYVFLSDEADVLREMHAFLASLG